MMDQLTNSRFISKEITNYWLEKESEDDDELISASECDSRNSDEGINIITPKQSDEEEGDLSEIEPEKIVSPSEAVIALMKCQKYFMRHSDDYFYSLQIEKMIEHINIYERRTSQTSIRNYFK